MPDPRNKAADVLGTGLPGSRQDADLHQGSQAGQTRIAAHGNVGQGQKHEIVVGITSSYFCAGLVIRGGKVIKAAPILRYMTGWTPERIKGYASRKGWKIDAPAGF